MTRVVRSRRATAFVIKYGHMPNLPVLNSQTDVRGKRVILRVDWNVPLSAVPHESELMKVKQSADTIKELSKRGAVTIVFTHLGRPEGWDKKYSTARLLPFAEAYIGKEIVFCGEDMSTEDGVAAVGRSLGAAKAGDVYLLENVRFYAGEEKNDKALARIYAALGELYVNDAFASCHRAHVSVAGIPALLPHYAGPNLAQEIAAADRLIDKPKKPFVAIIGGAKLSTKMPVIEALLKIADKVCIGGAMANPFLVARRYQIGKSLTEKEGVKYAKPLLKHPKIVLPSDLLVANKLDERAKPHAVDLKGVKKNEIIGDIGPQTMREWSALVKTAQTILWNGPVGVAEYKPFSHGSLVVGRAMASRSAGKAYGVVGGGDTIPVALETGMSEWFDHMSMGGGALLEYITEKGRLPGIEALRGKAIQSFGSRKSEVGIGKSLVVSRKSNVGKRSKVVKGKKKAVTKTVKAAVKKAATAKKKTVVKKVVKAKKAKM